MAEQEVPEWCHVTAGCGWPCGARLPAGGWANVEITQRLALSVGDDRVVRRIGPTQGNPQYVAEVPVSGVSPIPAPQYYLPRC